MSTLGLHERECRVCRARYLAPTFVGSTEQAAEYAKCPTCGGETQRAPQLDEVCRQVIARFPKQVEQYRAGKSTLGFLVGQVMRATLGAFAHDSDKVREALKRRLDIKT